MRVIEQLVHHFWARGALTRDQAQFLVNHGFARAADLPGLTGEDEAAEESGKLVKTPAKARDDEAGD